MNLIGLSTVKQKLKPINLQSYVETFRRRLMENIQRRLTAESYLYWEPEGSNGWFHSFYFTSNEFRIIESDVEYIVLEAMAAITVEAEGDFSLSVHDSIDDDYVHIDSVIVTTKVEFESAILITIMGNLDRPINELDIEDVEIVTPIKCIHFGTLEPDFDRDE